MKKKQVCILGITSCLIMLTIGGFLFVYGEPPLGFSIVVIVIGVSMTVLWLHLVHKAGLKGAD